MKAEVTAESVRAAPPAAVTAAIVATDITLNQWVAIATLAYIALQVGYLAWKWYMEYKAKQ